MAFNLKTFRIRTISAIVFVAIMLTGLLWNQWSFLVLFSIIHFGCWWEYFNLVEKIRGTRIHPFIRQGFMLTGFGFMLFFCGHSYQIEGYALRDNLVLPISAAGFALLIMGIFQKGNIQLKAVGLCALGWLYISLSWGLMIHLYHLLLDIHIQDTMYVVSNGIIPITIIVSIWINDTMAYLVGSLIGKHPLTKISPKKTWEGTIGGIILSVLVVIGLAALFYFDFMGWPFVILLGGIALIASIAGTFGDLLESKLKRMAGVKDSGQIMPGHGGFLDRFDSLLIATTVTAGIVELLSC